MRLKDKVAIITGCSRGIGKATAIRLAQDGANLVLCDVLDCQSTLESVTALGVQALTLKTDVSREEDTQAMVAKTIERFGKVDILVNNAAIFGKLEDKEFIKPLEEIRPDEWDRVMAVNVKGVFLSSKAVIPHFKSRREGKIINMASTTPLVGLPLFAHYATSKGAVITLTKVLARYLGDFNVNVNAVIPGLTWTEAVGSMYTEEFAQSKVETVQLLKKRNQPEDIANVVAFLASDEARMVTGAMYAVNAGEYMY